MSSDLTPAENLAQAIRQVARRAHSVEVETQVDKASSEWWGITERELKEIRRSP